MAERDGHEVVDCVTYATPPLEELVSYLAPEWRDGLGELLSEVPAAREAGCPEGHLPALGPDVEHALLWPGSGALLTGGRNPYLAAELAHAANEWMLERCFPADERLWGSILVATHMPERAAREIELRAREGLMRQVVICSNSLGRTIGHPVYRPLVEAAARAGLPLAIQSAGDVADCRASAGGTLGSGLERRTLASESLMTHLLGLISNGVFERFAGLRVVLAGDGIGWMASLLWRLDVNFKGVHREIPWVSRLPSASIDEHVRLTTYPIEQAPPGELATLVELAGGAELIIYGSGRPRTDAEPPSDALAGLPGTWHRDVLHANALALYGD